MPFNTPAQPSLERSSVTPPDADSEGRPRSSFRITTESARSKECRRLAHQERVAAQQKQLRVPDPPENARTWLELDSDDAGAGPLDKDDTLYQGPSVRSRIASVQAAREAGPITRRGSQPTRRGARDDSLEAPPSAQPRRHSIPSGEEGGDVHLGHLVAKEKHYRQSKKTFKSASIVVSTDDEELPSRDETRRSSTTKRLRAPTSGNGEETTRAKKARTARSEPDWSMLKTPSPARRVSPLRSPPPPPPLGSDDDLPSMGDIARGGRRSNVHDQSRGPMIDDEAVESGGEEGGVDGHSDDMFIGRDGEDDYDYNDPFIDDQGFDSQDSEASIPKTLGSDRHRSSRLAPSFELKSATKQRNVDLDSELDLSGDKRPLLRLTKGQRPPQDERPKPKPRRVQSVSEKEDRPNSQAAPKAQQAGKSSETAVSDAHRSSDKGKGKAVRRSSSPELVEGVGSGDDQNLSEMSEWERAQLELAIRNIRKGAGIGSLGESSSQQSFLPTPKATSLFTSASPALSTPNATAMFSTPGSNLSTYASPPQPNLASPLSTQAPLSMQELVRLSRANAAGTAAASAVPAPAVAPPPIPQTDVLQLTMLCSLGDIPTVCGCTHPSFQDPILAEVYPGLINLLPGHFEPWGHTPGPGFVMFSAWGDQCPSMNARVALDAVNFEESGYVRNPSRCSPANVGVYPVPGQKDRLNFYCAGSDPVPLVAVTMGMLEDSQILTPSAGGLRQKWVSIILHNQEMQRYRGFVRMVSGQPFLRAQYNKNALQFSTRPLYKYSENPNDKNKAQSAKNRSKSLRVPASKMFGSSGASNESGNRISAETFSLPAEATVPVYDARGVSSFDYNANLTQLAQTLPAWTEGEIPFASFVVGGHTISVYRSGAGHWTLGCNLQWVIVLGTPEHD